MHMFGEIEMSKIRFGHKHSFANCCTRMPSLLNYWLFCVCVYLPGLLNNIVKFLQELKFSFNVFLTFILGPEIKQLFLLSLSHCPSQRLYLYLGFWYFFFFLNHSLTFILDWVRKLLL